MKKLVRTSLNNVANKRGVRDLNIQLYSHDKNNAGFEFVIKNEVDLSEYKAKVLFDFQESFATWETKGTVEGNVVKVKFDTTFITKCEEVIGYLFLDSETDTLDVFKFKFNVVLSEIDKYDIAKRGFRYIKDQEVVDVITRSELQEELAKLQVNAGVDLNNYLTTSVANETFATKQELPSISGLVTTEQLTDAKNSVVEEINNKGYVTSTVAEETYAKKSEIPTPYNDSALVERVTNLENKTDNDTVYDDTPLKQRVEALETKVDKDTVYNDEEVKQRLTVLENKPTVDTSHFITDETLDSKNYLTTTVAEETYAKKSEIPQPYNDSPLNERVTALENRPSTGGAVTSTTSSEIRGTGMPNGVVEAPIGATYIDTAKTNGALKWIKTTDGGNTGWKVVEGDTGWLTIFTKDFSSGAKISLKIRRINNMVNVLFEGELDGEAIIKTIYDNNFSNKKLMANGKITDGFKPVSLISVPAHVEINGNEGFQDAGAFLFDIQNNTFEINLFTSWQLYRSITDGLANITFNYVTYESWPTELPGLN